MKTDTHTQKCCNTQRPLYAQHLVFSPVAAASVSVWLVVHEYFVKTPNKRMQERTKCQRVQSLYLVSFSFMAANHVSGYYKCKFKRF